MNEPEQINVVVDHSSSPTDVVGALARLFEDDDDGGGTECGVARCHAKATDTTVWRGVLVHVCSRHAAGNQEE